MLPSEIEQLIGLKDPESQILPPAWNVAGRGRAAGRPWLVGLETLDLSSCDRLVTSAAPFWQLIRLKTPNLSGCRQLRSLPSEVGQLTGLKTLNRLCRCRPRSGS